MSIVIDNLSKAYSDNIVLDRLSLELASGESYCLMGPSGCGKTTLLHIMMGLVKPDSGSVTGLDGLKLSPVFQENRLCENLSVGANIRLVCGKIGTEQNDTPRSRDCGRIHSIASAIHSGYRPMGWGLEGAPQRDGESNPSVIESVLCALGIPDVIHKPVKELSGGMARRAAIARAICHNGDVFIFDEPFKGLDDGTKEQVISYTREKCRGKTVIWVTHDAREAEFWGGHIIKMF